MRVLFSVLMCLLAAGDGLAQAGARGRVVESIVPWLDYDSSCWSTVRLQNLGDREVAVEVEDAIAFAESSPEPPLDSLYEHVFS